MAPEVVDQHIALYVNSFTADLGDEGYAAVTGLLDRAVAAGLTGTARRATAMRAGQPRG